MTSVVPLPTTVEMSSEVPKLLWEGFLFVGGVSLCGRGCNPDSLYANSFLWERFPTLTHFHDGEPDNCQLIQRPKDFQMQSLIQPHCFSFWY